MLNQKFKKKIVVIILAQLFLIGSVFGNNPPINDAPKLVTDKVKSLYRNPRNDLISYTYKIPDTEFWVVIAGNNEYIVVSEDARTVIDIQNSSVNFRVYETPNSNYVDASSTIGKTFRRVAIPIEVKDNLNNLANSGKLDIEKVGSKVLKRIPNEALSFKKVKRYWMVRNPYGELIYDTKSRLTFMQERNGDKPRLYITKSNLGNIDLINERIELEKRKLAMSFIKTSIDFKAVNEKEVLYVFTDPHCGYCRKLHSKVAKYNKEGITIRYVPINNFGDRSKPTLLKLLSIPPSKQAIALDYIKTQFSKRKPVNYQSIGFEKNSGLAEQNLISNKKAAKLLGVYGTPMIFDQIGKTRELDYLN